MGQVEMTHCPEIDLYLKLVTNDESKMPVARYHPRRLGLLWSNKSDASLEIFPAGEHMMDLIVVTFIYIEKVRRDK